MTGSSDIAVDSLRGNVMAQTRTGSITTDVVTGSVEVHSVSGGISSVLGAGLLTATTVSGGIATRVVHPEFLSCQLRSTSGAVELTLDEGVPLTVDVRSMGGAIAALDGERASGGRWWKQLEGGGSTVMVRTDAGAIVVRRPEPAAAVALADAGAEPIPEGWPSTATAPRAEGPTRFRGPSDGPQIPEPVATPDLPDAPTVAQLVELAEGALRTEGTHAVGPIEIANMDELVHVLDEHDLLDQVDLVGIASALELGNVLVDIEVPEPGDTEGSECAEEECAGAECPEPCPEVECSEPCPESCCDEEEDCSEGSDCEDGGDSAEWIEDPDEPAPSPTPGRFTLVRGEFPRDVIDGYALYLPISYGRTDTQ